MEKISIKNFVERYKRMLQPQKDNYIKEKLHIIPYLPFVNKLTVAERLVDFSTFLYENYTDENGETKRRKTDKIRVNSVVQYLLFCRTVIENYTNLTVESEGFYEEYDLLKTSGLFDVLFGSESNDALLPMDDISELKQIVKMCQEDVLYNETEIHSFVEKQVDRFKTLNEFTIMPLIDLLNEKKNEQDKVVEFSKNGNYKEV